MSRETKYTAIILKKQPYKEGDEIITFYTKEQGKVRALAKSVKLAKSKLQQRLQNLFLLNLTLSHGSMPKIISAEPVEVFSALRENLEAVKIAFYALELVLKFTPDEQKNEGLFVLFAEFLNFLNSEISPAVQKIGLAKFKINILQVLGLNVHYPAGSAEAAIFFSPGSGGFSRSRQQDSLSLLPETYLAFLTIKDAKFADLSGLTGLCELTELQNLLSVFVVDVSVKCDAPIVECKKRFLILSFSSFWINI